jgi:ABC-type phosphate/phosphonate transport system substrate-binding protein
VDDARDQADERRPARPRWIEAAGLALVAAAALGVLLVRGPFASSARHAPRAAPRRIAVTVAPDPAPGLDPQALAPVARHVEREALVDLELAASPSALAAVEALLDDRAAIAVLPALACVQAVELDRDVRLLAALAVDGAAVARTALVVRRGDEGVAALRGRTLCAADVPGSSGPALLARLWLRSRDIDPASAFSVTPHASDGELGALADLDARRCDVAAVGEGALHAAPAARAGRLDRLAWTGRVPLGCWAASGGLDGSIAQSVAAALLEFDPEIDGVRSRITGFVEPDASTFRAIRLAAQLDGQLRPQLPSRAGSEDEPPPPTPAR